MVLLLIPKIQYISTPKVSDAEFPNIEISSFGQFKVFDSFDFNIISLNNSKALMLNYDKFSYNNDYNSLMANMNETKDNNIILILPQNLSLDDNKGLIKNRLGLISLFIKSYTIFDEFEITYGGNVTKLEDIEISSDFFFKKYDGYEVITKNKNNKPTTIKKENYIITTLAINNETELIKLFEITKLISIDTPEPEWFEDIHMFDDEEQYQRIEINTEKINGLKEDILNAELILKENNEYKSILYKKSDELVGIVFKILENIMKYDLSDFKDVYKEDFLIEFEEVTFIGEIKGVNRNVSMRDLSQLDNHVTDREDNSLKIGKTETLKPLLIMNTFIDKPPSERPDVENVTIERAKNKYGTLIITSTALLELYEKYKNGKINDETIITRFKDETGLFIP